MKCKRKHLSILFLVMFLGSMAQASSATSTEPAMAEINYEDLLSGFSKAKSYKDQIEYCLKASRYLKKHSFEKSKQLAAYQKIIDVLGKGSNYNEISEIVLAVLPLLMEEPKDSSQKQMHSDAWESLGDLQIQSRPFEPVPIFYKEMLRNIDMKIDSSITRGPAKLAKHARCKLMLRQDDATRSLKSALKEFVLVSCKPDQDLRSMVEAFILLNEYAQPEIKQSTDFISIKEKMGKFVEEVEHMESPALHTSLGDVFAARGEFANSLQQYETALKSSANDSLWQAKICEKIAFLLTKMGNEGSALQYSQKSLDYLSKEGLADSSAAARVLKNMSTLEAAVDNSKATDYAKRSFEIYSRNCPATDVTVDDMAELGGVLSLAGDTEFAKKVFGEGKRILENNPEQAKVSPVFWSRYALFLQSIGQEDEARKALAKAKSTSAPPKGILPQSMVDEQTIFKNLAEVAVSDSAEKKLELEKKLLVLADNISKELRQSLPSMTFVEQCNLADSRLNAHSSALLLYAESCGLDKEVYDSLLKTKGLVIDALFRQRRITYFAKNSKDTYIRSLIQQWEALNQHLLKEFADAKQGASDNSKIIAISKEREQLFRTLSKLVPIASNRSQDLSSNEVMKCLKPDEALVDFYCTELRDQITFYCYVTGHQQSPVSLTFKAGERIRKAIKGWRISVQTEDYAPGHWKDFCAIWDQVKDKLPPGTKRVWVCPDADMVHLPWALISQDNFATRNLEVAEIDSPREIVNLRKNDMQTVLSKKFCLVRNVENSQPVEQLPEQQECLKRYTAPIEESIGGTLHCIILQKKDATKDRVISTLASARMAHINTHGFFQHSIVPIAGNSSQAKQNSLLLLNSGIVLSGAKEFTAADQHNLSAEEVLSQDFSNLRFLSLSACDSAHGESIPGQGQIGLRSSFIAAGVRSLLIALWEVPALSSEMLMNRFYENLMTRKMSQAASLLEAQRFVKQDPRFKAPRFWAGWVLTGDAFSNSLEQTGK